MSAYVVRPISDRTQFKGGAGTFSDFTVTWSQAETLLLDELHRIRASNAVVELDLNEGQLRLDGRPKAAARTASRAVRVSFKVGDETLTFATDKFVHRGYVRNGMTEDWQHNVYAIAKGMEALRMMKRYGIVESDQQYAGFKAIGSGTAMGASSEPPMERAAAARVIALMVETDPAAVTAATELIAATALNPQDADLRAKLIRRAKANAHPDRHGGNDERWRNLAPALAVFGAS